MVVVLAIGFVANLVIKAVPDRFHEPAEKKVEAAA
jgi:hypothetical protein